MPKPKKPLKSWCVKMEYKKRGIVLVDAIDAKEAITRANMGQFEVASGDELIDWLIVGEVRENV